MPICKVACVHRLPPRSARIFVVGREFLGRAGNVSFLSASRPSQGPGSALTSTTNFKRGSGLRCYAMVETTPMSGNSSTKAQKPVTRSRDAATRKATAALHYAVLAGHRSPPPSPTHEHKRVPGEKGSMDLWWNESIAELVVAFQAPKSALSTVSGQSGQPQCLANVRKLKLKEGEVQVEPSLTGVLDDLLHAAAFKMLRGLCGDVQPRRVVCTGIGGGGSVARVAAVLLAVDYPFANVRCVTLDSPDITYGNPAFAALTRFLVAFNYNIDVDPTKLGMLDKMDHVKLAILDKVDQVKLPIFDKVEPFLHEEFVKSTEDILHSLCDRHFSLKINALGYWSEWGLDKIYDKVAEKSASWETADSVAAVVSAAAFSAEEDGLLMSLHAKDRDVSLAWGDEAVTAPFHKPLDTVEKLLLVGNRVPALAGMSAAAYKDKEGFAGTTGIPGQMCRFVNKPWSDENRLQLDGQCHVVWRPAINTLIVAFRGSAQRTDWFVDLDMFHLPATFLDSIVNDAKVHSGFHGQLLQMLPDITEAIKDLRRQNGAGASVEHIITTGHSLGGGLATIGGPLLAKEFPLADVSVISFAAPRAGNAAFSEAFATLIGSSMRFQYNYDVVPCVPTWYLGFKHVAPDAYLRSGDPKEGIDDGAELDLYADPPRGFAQYVKTVRDLSADKLWDLFQHDEYVKAARDEQDPPWDPIQCVAAVGWQDLIEKLTANHSIVYGYIGSLVGYMQRLHDEENAGGGTTKL